ncbi:hypothetical protein ElyMa_000694900 [Elysia marginata]|uniref:Uncharacterized protein n=1 Tax=Elysia marginata TaxID=1093978 RepID=A0AAV4GI62_9GAST|nr:hypothetical protein ElyMa_000694900 [Elysia marginata]
MILSSKRRHTSSTCRLQDLARLCTPKLSYLNLNIQVFLIRSDEFKDFFGVVAPEFDTVMYSKTQLSPPEYTGIRSDDFVDFFSLPFPPGFNTVIYSQTQLSPSKHTYIIPQNDTQPPHPFVMKIPKKMKSHTYDRLVKLD